MTGGRGPQFSDMPKLSNSLDHGSYVPAMPHGEYLLTDYLSHSRLKNINPTPAHFLSALKAEDREVTPAMIMGTLVHALILGETLDGFIAIEPETYGPEDKKWNNNAKECREWHARLEKAGVIALKKSEYDTVLGCATAVAMHPTCQSLLNGGAAEVSFFGTDLDTEIPVKFRPDYMGLFNAIIDIKTVPPGGAAPEVFAKHAWDMGYVTQAAFYLNQYNAMFVKNASALPIYPNPWLSPKNTFVTIAVEKGSKEKGLPFAVALYEYDDIALEKAREINFRRMRTLANCIYTGDYPGYSKDVQVISAPRWALQS